VTVSSTVFVPVASQQLTLIATKAEGGSPLQVQIHFRFLAVTMATKDRADMGGDNSSILRGNTMRISVWSARQEGQWGRPMIDRR
jgi:hypothetical protein